MGVVIAQQVSGASASRKKGALGKELWRQVALLLFAAWVFTIGSHHEPWFDEAQAWLVARDNALWPLLAERVRYEGTPGLWHAILSIVQRAGLPYSDLYVVPALFAIGGAAVMLWRAPFPPVVTVSIVASYFFAYQFSVVARSYCITLLLVPLAASFFANRKERPLRYALVIGLLANTNAHGFLAAAILGLELAWQSVRGAYAPIGRSLPALVLAGGMGLFAAWSAWQPADNAYLQQDRIIDPVSAGLRYFSNAFLDRLAFWDETLPGGTEMILAFTLSLILQRPAIQLVTASRNRGVSAAILIVLLLFSAMFYASPWHAGLLFLFWVFVLWINWGAEVPSRVRRQLIGAILLIAVPQAVQAARSGLWDMHNSYSAGEQAARAIADYHKAYPGQPIAAFGMKTFEMQPWLAGNLFANYHRGAPKPAYWVWAKGEPLSPRVNARTLAIVIAQHPALIAASPVDMGGRGFDLMPQLCSAGYGIRAFYPATMIWRGQLIEDQTLLLLARGRREGCKDISNASQGARNQRKS